MNAHDSHHWTLNSCFGAFLSVWVHLGPFRYCTKMRQTGAINAKVRSTMSCQIFHNKHFRSIQLDPNLMFWCVSFRLGAFGTVSLLHEIWYITRQTRAINVKVRAIKSCRNFLQRHSRSTTLDPKLIFWCVSFCSGVFGTVSLLHKNAPSWCN